LKLERRDAFLRGAEQGERHEPLAERKMRILEDRSDRDGELLMAVVALEDARTVCLALEPG
jgi:hypothetical protein